MRFHYHDQRILQHTFILARFLGRNVHRITACTDNLFEGIPYTGDDHSFLSDNEVSRTFQRIRMKCEGRSSLSNRASTSSSSNGHQEYFRIMNTFQVTRSLPGVPTCSSGKNMALSVMVQPPHFAESTCKVQRYLNQHCHAPAGRPDPSRLCFRHAPGDSLVSLHTRC